LRIQKKIETWQGGIDHKAFLPAQVKFKHSKKIEMAAWRYRSQSLLAVQECKDAKKFIEIMAGSYKSINQVQKAPCGEGLLTARLSVATAATTNMRMKVVMISSKSDCASLPTGRVAPSFASGFKMRRKANAEAIAPKT